MSCVKAQGFLETHRLEVADQTNATKERKGRAEALALAWSADRVVAGKGKKVVVFDMRRDPPDDETLLAHLLGPTGNLKAPTIRTGKTLLVGFSEEAYRQVLGEKN
jgi:arsenate reductase-like glutaredoxin family protein